MKIVFLQRVLPAYREPLFNALREQASQAGHVFELWVSSAGDVFARRDTEGWLSWARLLGVKALPFWLGGFEYQTLPWREVLAADVVFVPDSLRCVSNELVLLLRRLRGKPVFTWGHGVNFQKDFFSKLLAFGRYRLLRVASGNLVYTQNCLSALLDVGFNQNRIGVSENAIDTTQAFGLHAQHPEVLAFRLNHGLGNDPVVVFLGSWYARKRPEVVIKVGKALRQLVPEARVVVIGGGDGLAVLASHARQLPWLTLLGPLRGREKFVALASASCMAVSGVAGLNLLDAMAVGLPVVLPQRADHSPEVFYVLDGINGLVLPDKIDSLAEGCCRLIKDRQLRDQLSAGARKSSAKLSIETMAGNILRIAIAGEKVFEDLNLIGKKGPVVFVYQRMLPYHSARFMAVSDELCKQGRLCIAVEVASFDRGYGTLSDISSAQFGAQASILCLFAETDYLDLNPRRVARAVLLALRSLAPSVVFAPAPAFAEGAGAMHYKVLHGGQLVLMDDAWSMTDHRGMITRLVKQIMYTYMDGGFFPDRLHGDYFAALNIPYSRQRYPVDVVGPVSAGSCSLADDDILNQGPYLLFVGRLILRKGLDVILRAMAGFSECLRLVVIGEGPDSVKLHALASELGLDSRVKWLGRCNNTESRLWMGQAEALLVPSQFEQWGLVVNEAWMVPTLVLGSESVGALRATYSNKEMQWMMVPVDDVAGWQRALSLLLALQPEERQYLLGVTRILAEKFSMAMHTQSALELINLPHRVRPLLPAGWLALAWKGRVKVW